MRRALFFVLAACGPAAPAPATVDVSKTQAPAPTVTAHAPAREALSDWHWRMPAAEIGPDGKQRYPAVQWTQDWHEPGCRATWSGVRGYVLCSHDILKIDGTRLDLAFSKTVALEGYAPTSVEEKGDELWLRTTPLTDGAFDAFYDTTQRVLLSTGGKWQKFSSNWAPQPYQGGHLVFTTLPVERNESCVDASCIDVVPKLEAFGTKDKPDFSSFAGKFRWIHPSEIARDFEIAVDPDGPVYVLMRVLETATKKRGMAVARWTPKGGVKVEWLPAPLATLATEQVWVSGGTASKGKASFDVGANIKGETRLFAVAFDGTKWLVGAGPTGSPTEIEAEDPSATLIDGEMWSAEANLLYREHRPDEVFVQSDRWGRLHPFAPPADEDCRTPFAVMDRLESAHLAHAMEHGDDTWGRLPEGYGGRLLKMEYDGLVVFGVTFDSTAEAPSFLDRTPWTSPRSGLPAVHVVVCARPADAKPFTRPRD